MPNEYRKDEFGLGVQENTGFFDSKPGPKTYL